MAKRLARKASTKQPAKRKVRRRATKAAPLRYDDPRVVHVIDVAKQQGILKFAINVASE